MENINSLQWYIGCKNFLTIQYFVIPSKGEYKQNSIKILNVEKS